MINPRIEIIFIICLAAIACIIPGIMLTKKRLALYSGGVIASSILGIIASYAIFRNIDLPPIVFLITAISFVVILFMDKLEKAQIPRDIVTGVIPPFIFSVALIFISLFPNLEINIDIDTILLGELVFLPLDRLFFFGFDLGPLAVYQLLGVIAMNIAMTVLIEKEMVFSMFDDNYSLMIDHSAVRSRLVLLLATIITAVVTFRVTGIIMILGLIIAPAFIASFLTRRLWLLIVLASLAGISSSLAGYAAAHILEITISASIVSALGVILLITAIFAPKSGIIARRAVKKQAEIERAIALISAHLLRQEGNSKKADVDFSRKFNWSRDFINTVFNKAENYITSGENGYMLTERGRALARDVAAGCKLPDRLP